MSSRTRRKARSGIHETPDTISPSEFHGSRLSLRSAGMTGASSMATISLPTKARSFAPYTTGEPIVLPKKGAPPKFNRVAYAAAHVVADPLADNDPWLEASVDWDKTIAFREYLWDLGLGVAEAMDTAQRGMGLDWNGAKELIRRALEAAKARPGVRIACGVGTDHLAPGKTSIDDIIRAYEEQIETVEQMGGQLIVMASRA